MSKFLDKFRSLLRLPTDDLTRKQYALRYVLEMFRQGLRRLREDRAGNMAAALAFRTIFGLVPVLIIVILIFRAFGGAEVFGSFLEGLLQSANLDSVAAPDGESTLGTWLRNMIESIDGKISGRAVGLVGLLVLAWAAIGLISTIERSLNTICQATTNRALTRRIPLYWTMLTVGPALLYLSFDFRTRFLSSISETSWVRPFAGAISVTTAFLSVWLLLLLLYRFLPNKQMRLQFVAAGSFFAALLWSAATNLFAAYIAWSFIKESSTFSVLYGTLGLLPLFLFWIYFLWIIVLYGFELTCILQAVQRGMHGGTTMEREPPPFVDPAYIVVIMHDVLARFEKGEPTHEADLVEATQINAVVVELMLQALHKAGFVHRVDHAGEDAWAPAKPAEQIRTQELIELGQSLVPLERGDDGDTDQWLHSFRQAQRQLEVHRSMDGIS